MAVSDFSAFSNHPELTFLQVKVPESFTGEDCHDGILLLNRLPQLSGLHLESNANALSDECVEHLSKFESLQSLSIHHGEISVSGWEHLQHLTNLKQLSLQGNAHAHDIVQGVQAIQSLEELRLPNSRKPIPASVLAKLDALQKLKTVYGGHSRIELDVAPFSIAAISNRIDFKDFDESSGAKVSGSSFNRCQISEGELTIAAAKQLITNPSLKHLMLNKVTLNAEAALLIAAMPSLNHLAIEKCDLSDSILSILTSNENLNIVRIKDCPAGEIVASSLASLPRLSSLELEFTDITDAGFSKFRKSKSLTALKIVGTFMTDQGLEELAECSTLRSVQISLAHLTNKGAKAWESHPGDFYASGVSARFLKRSNPLPTIPRSTSARVLSIALKSGLEFYSNDHQPLSSEVLSALAPQEDLITLQLSDAKMGDRDLDIILPKKKLRNLDVANNPITDAGLEKLGECSVIDDLRLIDTQVTGSFAKEVASMKSVRSLYLGASQVNDAGIFAICKAFPNLESINLTNTKVTAACLTALANHASLKSVDLSSTSIGMQDIRALRGSHSIESVMLTQNNIDFGLYRKSDIDSVSNAVSMSGEIWTDDDVRSFQGQDHIDRVTLHRTKIGDEGLRTIVSMPSLRSLTIIDQNISAESFEILSLAKRLKKLDVVNTQLTQEHWKIISVLPSLEDLTLKQVDVVDEDMKFLPAKIKKLTIASKKLTDHFWDVVDVNQQLTSLSVYWEPFSMESVSRFRRQRSRLEFQLLPNY